MSQSQQFANYSNSAQALKSSIDQLGETDKQTTDDAKQFEAEYLTGIAVASKTKFVDGLVGLLKKSKGVKKATSVIEDVKKTANQKINDLADDLTSRIPKLDNTPPITNPSASTDKLSQLKTIADEAAVKAKGTSDALESAENEVIDSRDAVRTTSEARDAKQIISETKDAELVSKAGGPISSAEQQAATDARLDLNNARSDVDSAIARSDAAERNVQDLAQQSQAHTAEASRAADDLQVAKDAPDDITPAPDDITPALSTTEKVGEDGEKALKVTKDVEEGGAETDDPVGLIVAGIAAIASTIIGRRLKVHENQITSSLPPSTPLNYTSTLGA